MPANSGINLDAAAIRAELLESPETHDLSTSQVARINALSDEQLNLVLADKAGNSFWAEYDDVRNRAIATLANAPLVCVTFQQGDDYETAVDAANNDGGSIEAVARHLAQWDYGSETDEAAAFNGYVDLSTLEALPHQLHEIEIDNTTYWISLDHGLRFYGLYRQPLEK